MGARIRQVPHDDPQLQALHALTFPSDPFPEWRRGAWWLVTIDGRAVAFAGVQPSAHWRGTGYLVRAGVLPEARGQGLQRRLVRVRERFARAAGWRWLITATLRNPASANSLIACGFRMYEPASPWLADGALYWRKRV